MHPLLDEYATYHRDSRNRLMHEIGIPLIVLGITAVLRIAHLGAIDLALVAIVAVSIYYARIAGMLAAPAIAGLVVIYLVAAFVSWPLAIVLFLIGWIFQFIGHVYEGKKPAFLTNLLHLLVGPLWIGVILTRRHA